MAHDLATTPTTRLFVQLCGDCQPANFGSCLTGDRTLVFDLKNFDETLPGPWEWDLKRLATGLFLAGQHNGLHRGLLKDAPRSAVQSYREHMIEFAAMRTLDVWNSRVSGGDLAKILSTGQSEKRGGRRSTGSQPDNVGALVTRIETVDGMRRIAECLPSIVRLDSSLMEESMHRTFREYRHALNGSQRSLLAQYRLVDAARIAGGADSQALESYVWLLEGKDVVDTVFLRLKEARQSVLEPYVQSSVYKHHGQRVVAGQQRIQSWTDPFLGRAWSDDGREYTVREVQTIGATPAIRAMGASDLAHYAETCGWALARAHARSGDRIQIAAYMGEGKSFDRAIADFAETYAAQVERDFRALVEWRQQAGTVRANKRRADKASLAARPSA